MPKHPVNLHVAPLPLGVSALALAVVAVAVAFSVAGCDPDYPSCETDKNCHAKEFCVNAKCQQCRDSNDCPAGNACLLGGFYDEPVGPRLLPIHGDFHNCLEQIAICWRTHRGVSVFREENREAPGRYRDPRVGEIAEKTIVTLRVERSVNLLAGRQRPPADLIGSLNRVLNVDVLPVCFELDIPATASLSLIEHEIQICPRHLMLPRRQFREVCPPQELTRLLKPGMKGKVPLRVFKTIENHGGRSSLEIHASVAASVFIISVGVPEPRGGGP
jgi:hypothetical protein